MYAGQGIPTWVISALSGYSLQQTSQALKWAMENLPPPQLKEYYKWALYYRPAFRRELQQLVDRMGMKIKEDEMRYSNRGMTEYLGNYDPDAYFDDDANFPPPPPPPSGGGQQGGANPLQNFFNGISNIGQAAGGAINAAQQMWCKVNPRDAMCTQQTPTNTQPQQGQPYPTGPNTYVPYSPNQNMPYNPPQGYPPQYNPQGYNPFDPYRTDQGAPPVAPQTPPVAPQTPPATTNVVRPPVGASQQTQQSNMMVPLLIGGAALLLLLNK